ncbi:hypothetical protein BDV38DRAFT_295823 [Aspergillus pseudotamarii]|uniref:Peptidase M61 catalytic domain-containing protein n=1 Tax=Aspergillus pseudotamarii TaxID=132259 RepID=A0A5N6SIZ9_ASPPS|nr:uncharacterized protein BDV38DRAFT_295823 [Aspergillus pseudotamarii]KAE8133867.1 hypothetical protein BDV38DRAFT_295823 [Aspergillus pseudotamarii]
MNYFIRDRSEEDTRTFTITITPHFDAEGAHPLSMQQILSNPSCAAHQPLFIFETKFGNLPAHPFPENMVGAYDEASDSPDEESRVNRNTAGDVTLQFHRPRVDMRRDQGGVCSDGRWLLPRPAVEREDCNIVEWDLAQAPEGTRAVWSYGEGPGPVTKEGKLDVVSNSVFMVGPINKLPENLQRLNQYNLSLFPKLAGVFQRKDASYRAFLRNTVRGFGGSLCLESYVLEYDGMGWKETDEDLVSLFSHEMIHSFSLMNPEAAGYDNGWYIEGVAEFYSIFLPYRFGLRGLDFLRNRLHTVLLEYGTSPRIEMDAIDAQHEFLQCLIDSFLRRVTGQFGFDQNSPLDDIIVDMGKRLHRGKQVWASDWLEYLRAFLGEDMDVSEDFWSLLRGQVRDLRAVVAINKYWSLSSSMQEILETGFDKSSNSTRIVAGVLEDGDHIATSSRIGLCDSSLSAYYELVIERAGERIQISY